MIALCSPCSCEAVALALALGGAAGSRAAEEISQATWDSLFERGLLRTTSHGVPGADMETDITSEGRDYLVALLRRGDQDAGRVDDA